MPDDILLRVALPRPIRDILSDMLAHIQYGHDVDVARWTQLHLAGLVPDLVPYGLNHLPEFSVDTTFQGARTGVVKLICGVGDRFGLDALIPVTERTARSKADIVFSWSEAAGVPTALARHRSDPPHVSGVIWGLDRGRSKLLSGATWFALQRCDGLVVQSRGQIDPLIQLGITPSKIFYVPMGIDTKLFAATESDEPCSLRIVAMGNDIDRDWTTFQRCARILADMFPAIEVGIYTHSRSAQPTDKCTVYRNVKFLPAIRSAYCGAAAVAIPTRLNHHASGVTVALEAMSCGRPVVACDTPGMSEYIEEGLTGFLVPPGDADAMAYRLTHLLRNPGLALDMGREAEKRVRDRFTSRRMSADLAAVLTTVASH